MSFIESPRFPEEISYGSSGGPVYSTTISESNSGHEKRNINWSLPRHEYNAALGVTHENFQDVLDFFHVAYGRAYGFRFKDWLDYKSCGVHETVSNIDQVIGTGDGSETQYQIIKTYVVGSSQKVRNITKPVSGTILIAFDGVDQASGWSVDTTTGIVTFSTAPGIDVEVSAGFEFDVPVRFNTDAIDASIDDYNSLNATIPLVELKA
jgi:uncharacterized protein (TIGR02217 family)